MFTKIDDDRLTSRLCGATAALAVGLLLAGCSSAVTADEPPAVTEASEAPAESSDEWNDIWNGEGVEPIDGVAEDFPAQLPLPDGELVISAAGDGVWDMLFETDESQAQAEQLIAALDQILMLEEEGEADAGGHYWIYSDATYRIFVQMQPGPQPPPMVALTVIEQ